jgi:hypothetical protein
MYKVCPTDIQPESLTATTTVELTAGIVNEAVVAV